jgi:benzil reductase ((S)-benzoin forming)
MDVLTIVTGASSGLGRALLTAAPVGHRVDISRSGPPPAADEHLQADLADPASWPRVIAEVARLVHSRGWGRVVIVQSAGTIDPIGFAGEVDPDGYAASVLLNGAAPQVLGAGFLGAMHTLSMPRDLVCISSGAARTPYAGWSAYSAAKAATDHWVRTVGAEQRLRGGVRVLSVAPGVLATDMQAVVRAADERDFPRVGRFRDLQASGELADPEQVAVALWQLLDDAEVSGGEVIDLRDR